MSTARVELLPHRDAWRAEFLALAARVRADAAERWAALTGWQVGDGDA